MPMVSECQAEGCSTLTMGRFCLEHEKQFVGAAGNPQSALSESGRGTSGTDCERSLAMGQARPE